jgi:hypothetical protein
VERLLFTESGGYCANPECPSPYLFRDHSGHELDEDHIPTVANIAHVIADSPAGPRGNTDGGQRDRFENLVLLCANCHNIVDDMRLSGVYSVEKLLGWKRSHRERVASQFTAREFADRTDLNNEIAARLRENNAIWQQWGPDGVALSQDPAATDVADEWRRRARETILPNNRLILAVADRNAHLLSGDELAVVEQFRVHAEAFARGQLGNPVPDTPRFPQRMNEFFPSTTG